MISQFPINANSLIAQADLLNSTRTNIGQSKAMQFSNSNQAQWSKQGPFWANTLSPSEQF